MSDNTTKIYDRNDVFKSTLDYFNGDELATNTWINKYALKDSYGNIYELNPDDMHVRLAKEIYRIEQKYPNPLSYDLILSLIKDFKYLVPAGGSLTGIGNNFQVSSLSNCFVVGNPYDSYGSIFYTDEQQVQLMKRRGGVGHDLSHIRPKDSLVNNSALTSTGVVPFMERYSNSTREVAQCIAKGERILTQNGLKPIEDIETGEFVWTKVGWVKVNKLHKNGEKKIFKTVTSRGYSIRTTEEHIFLDEDLKEKRIKDFELNKNITLIEEGGGLFLDYIVDYYEDGFDETFDLELEKEHLFYCEGFYVHNSGRRGALMLSFSINHPDSEDFINAKLEDGKVTGANISVKIGNDFMQAVIDDKPYTQKYPIYSENPIVTKEVDSKRLWNKIIHNVWKSAEPGVLFWDKIIEESPADCYEDIGFKTVSTNPCGEIPLCAYDSCRLLALNLDGYTKDAYTKNATFDFDLFKEHAQYALRIMDDIIDLEIEKIEQIINKIKSDSEPDYIKQTELSLWENVKDMAIKGRRTGVGITSEGDMLAALGLTYGSPEGINLSEKVHKTLATEVYISSILLAKDRGSFKVFDVEKEKNNPFIRRVLLDNPDINKAIIEQYTQSGRRNISCLTIAPTGSLSILTQTTSGIEPAFGIKYKRKRKINPSDKGVNLENIEYDKQNDAWEKYNVYHHGFLKWAKINNHDLNNISDEEYEKLYQISPYYKSTSADVDWVAKVEMQGRVQKWVDHSISVTVNLPNEITEEIVSEVYMTAWKSGCKGITVYREGSREGVMVSDKHQNKIENLFKEFDVPKRPKVVEADIIHFNNKGEKWVGVLGLVQDRPIEIFTGKWNNFMIPMSIEKGFVIKTKENGSTRYDFQYIDSDGYKCTMEGLNRAFNREYHNYARLISGVLRQGMPLIYVYELIDGLRLEDGDSITDWKSGVKRLIKKHIKDGVKTKDLCPDCGANLIFAENCKKCMTCGYTACG